MEKETKDKPLLAYTLWLSYPQDVKNKLCRLFTIPRTGESVVHVGAMIDGNISGERKQDGHKPEDLYAVTVSRMTELLNLTSEEVGTEPNFYALFQEVINNLDAIYAEQYPEEAKAEAQPVSEPVLATPEVAPAVEEIAEFVPRDFEEFLKKSTPDTGDTIDTEISKELYDDKMSLPEEVTKEVASVMSEKEELITQPKTGKNAETTKAKAAKTK